MRLGGHKRVSFFNRGGKFCLQGKGSSITTQVFYFSVDFSGIGQHNISGIPSNINIQIFKCDIKRQHLRAYFNKLNNNG